MGFLFDSAICAYDACIGLGGGAGVLVDVWFAAFFRASQSDKICWLMDSIFALYSRSAGQNWFPAAWPWKLQFGHTRLRSMQIPLAWSRLQNIHLVYVFLHRACVCPKRCHL